ncbi:MAG: hypothetical protein RLZZ531_1360 [Bacteroidota bacterium]
MVQKGYGQSIASIKKRADAAFEKKEFEEAKIDYRQLLAQNQKNIELNYKYATCIYYTEDIKNARKYFDFILSKKEVEFPLETYFYLGKIYQHQYYFETAIEQFSLLKQKDPKLAASFEVESEINYCRAALAGMKDLQTLEVIQKSEPFGADFYEHYRFVDDGYSFYKASEVFSKENAKHNYEPIYAFKRGMKFRVFASYGPESSSLDLYVQRKNAENEWDKPSKIQGIANTLKDEAYPFFDSENGYLYFSSKGHESMGGFDLFRSIYKLEDNQSSNVENLHFPYSSPNDDYFYVPDLINGNANFASNRNGKLAAIQTYLVRSLASTKELYFFTGVLSDNIDPGNSTVKVEFIVPETNERFGPFISRTDGSYLAGLPGAGSYQMEISITGSNQMFKELVVLPILDEDMELQQELVYAMVDSKEKLKVLNHVRTKQNESLQLLGEKMNLAANLDVNLASFQRKTVLSTEQQFQQEWGVVAKDTNAFIAIMTDSLLAAEVNLENQVRLTNYLATELSNLHKTLEGQMAALDERLEKGIGTLDAAENEQWLELTKQMESDLKMTEEQIQFLETWMLANQQRGIPNVTVLNSLEKLNQELAQSQFQQNQDELFLSLKENKTLIKNQLEVAGEDLSAVIRTYTEKQQEELIAERTRYQEQGENLAELEKEIAFLKTTVLAAKTKDRPAIEAEIQKKEQLSKSISQELVEWNQSLSKKEQETKPFTQMEEEVQNALIASEQTPLPTSAIPYDLTQVETRQKAISQARIEQKQKLIRQEEQVKAYGGLDPRYQTDLLKINEEQDSIIRASQLKQREETHLALLNQALSKNSTVDEALLSGQIQLTENRIQNHVEFIQKASNVVVGSASTEGTQTSTSSTRTTEEGTNTTTELGSSTENAQTGSSSTGATQEGTNTTTELGSSTENTQTGTSSTRTTEEGTNTTTELGSSTETTQTGSSSTRTTEEGTNTTTELGSSTENTQTGTSSTGTTEEGTNTTTELGSSTETTQTRSSSTGTTEEGTNTTTELGTSTETTQTGSSSTGTKEEGTNSTTELGSSTESTQTGTSSTGTTEEGTNTITELGSSTESTQTNDQTSNSAIEIDPALEVISLNNIPSNPQISAIESQLEQLRKEENATLTKTEKEKRIEQMEFDLDLAKRQEAVQVSMNRMVQTFPSIRQIQEEDQRINKLTLEVQEQAILTALSLENNPERKSMLEAELKQVQASKTNQSSSKETQITPAELEIPLSRTEPVELEELRQLNAYFTYVNNRVNYQAKEQELVLVQTKKIVAADSIRNLLTSTDEIQVKLLRRLAAQFDSLDQKESQLRQEIQAVHAQMLQSENQADFEWMIQHQVQGKTKSSENLEEAMVPSSSPFVVSPVTNLNQVFPAHPVNVPLPDGLIFRVQVGAFRKPVPNQLFREFGPVSGELLPNGLTCYLAGYFNGTKDALDARTMIRRFGYADAFIVAYCDGKRITYNQGKMMEQNGTCRKKTTEELQMAVNQILPGIVQPVQQTSTIPAEVNNAVDPNSTEANLELYYTVQVAVYNKAIATDNIKGVNELLVTKTEKGQYRYSSGEFISFDEARKRKNEVVAKGIPDAYVVAYHRGKRISIAQANQLEASGIRPKKRGENASINETNQFAQTTQLIEVPEIKPVVKVDTMVQYELKVEEDNFLPQLTRLNRIGTFTYQADKNRIISEKYKLENISIQQQMYLSDMKRMNERKSRIPSVTFELSVIKSEQYDWLLHQSVSYEVEMLEEEYVFTFYPENKEQADLINAAAQEFKWTIKQK